MVVITPHLSQMKTYITKSTFISERLSVITNFVFWALRRSIAVSLKLGASIKQFINLKLIVINWEHDVVIRENRSVLLWKLVFGRLDSQFSLYSDVILLCKIFRCNWMDSSSLNRGHVVKHWAIRVHWYRLSRLALVC